MISKRPSSPHGYTQIQRQLSKEPRVSEGLRHMREDRIPKVGKEMYKKNKQKWVGMRVGKRCFKCGHLYGILEYLQGASTNETIPEFYPPSLFVCIIR